MYQSSPGGQSSCSSQPSPLGSATHHDGGIELSGPGGGSMGDLSMLDDVPLVDSTVSTGTLGLHLRRSASPARRLNHLKQEKLKTVRESCSWANAVPQAPDTKLPPIPSTGKTRIILCYICIHFSKMILCYTITRTIAILDLDYYLLF